MSIASQVKDLRAARKLRRINDYQWAIKSTDGSKTHTVTWDDRRKELVCTYERGGITFPCPTQNGPHLCWHRRRVNDWLSQRFAGTVTHKQEVAG